MNNHVVTEQDDRERDDEGNFTNRVSDDEIVEFVRKTLMCTTGNVADEFSYSQRGAYRRLDQLVEVDRLEKQKAGASNVWTVVDED